jgi:AraC family transcriptional regulator, regulatory protein of adaptative response / DNA-3-methyladenine glycosylase II
MSESGMQPGPRAAIVRPMLLDPDLCYRALAARDRRFDGEFFVGVASTGIYCRPVCTARRPRRENCTFHPSAAAAESAGFRPCLRCRPELAPGAAPLDAPERLARTAANLIDEGALDDGSLEALASRLSVTDRHLRRVFTSHFGVAPVAYAQTQRLLLAKRLLTDTDLPITDVAYAAGFGSFRRFHSLFRARYRMAPSDLRHARRGPAPANPGFLLSYRPPYEFDALLAFLGARTIDGVEVVADDQYARSVRVVQRDRVHTGWIAVTHAPDRLGLRVTLSPGLVPVIPAVLQRTQRLFDLAANPEAIAQQLGDVAAAAPGLRLPGAFDGFEMAVRAVLGQQVTVKAARTLAGRVARAFGEPLDSTIAGLDAVFPTPERIAALDVPDIASLGVIRTRASAILAIARAVANGTLRLSPATDVAAQMDALRALPGIGDWTAQYIAMRALAWPDAFPHGDLGVRKALGTTNDRGTLAAAESWRPWRGYAVMHLWRQLA